jgi:hypothetical protein
MHSDSETCDYCNKNKAFKTNGESKNECYNKAHHGDCFFTNTDGPKLTRTQRRAKERLLQKLIIKHGNKKR